MSMENYIEQNDYDFLARKMGFKDMKEVRRLRIEEEEAARIAKAAAEAKAMEEELIKRAAEEEAEVVEALKRRIKVRLDGEVLKGLKGSEQLVCPSCKKTYPFAKEVLMLAARRTNFTTELWVPQWRAYNGTPGLRNDFIPAGSNHLIMRAPAFIFVGKAACPCGCSAEIEIGVSCVHDGEPVDTFKER